MAKSYDPAIIARNERILASWNADHERSANEIAMSEKCTREVVCGVIYRARQKNLVTRPKFKGARKGGKIGRLIQRRALMRQSAFILKALPEIAPQLAAAMSEAVIAVRPNQCRFPVDCERLEFKFCQEVQIEGSSFCSHHHRVVWVNPNAVRRARRGGKS